MADFYPVLARAIAALPNNTPIARAAIYDRARSALTAKLRAVAPPMAEADIQREVESLLRAAARVEAEQMAEAGKAPSAPLPLPPEAEEPPLTQPPPLAPEPPPPPPAQARPRLGAAHKAEDGGDRKRLAIVGGGVGVMVALIAALAFYVNRDAPEQPASRPAPAVAPSGGTPDDKGGKIGERVGSESAAPAPAARSELPVAQRAVLYIETPEDPQKPQTVGGRVTWRLDSESVGQGRPVETVVRASVDIPESGLSLAFTVRRNADPSFPASHIVGLRFSRTSDDGNGAVKEVGVPQLKGEEGERGAPLSAISSSLGDNLFVCALSNVQIEIDRNIDLLTKRNWIDLPIRFASGKRAIVAFEKGYSGDQTITDAFNRWR